MPKYRLVGGGSHRMPDGKVLRKGEVVECEEWEIQSQFMDRFELVKSKKRTRRTSRTTTPKKEPTEKSASTTDNISTVADSEGPKNFRLEHRGSGRYNVVNVDTGEPINDSLLSKKEASNLMNSYSRD